MDILATLRRSGGIETLSRRLDVAPAEAGACADVLTPMLVAGLRGFADGQAAGDEALEAVVRGSEDAEREAEAMAERQARVEAAVQLLSQGVREILGADRHG